MTSVGNTADCVVSYVVDVVFVHLLVVIFFIFFIVVIVASCVCLLLFCFCLLLLSVVAEVFVRCFVLFFFNLISQ